MSTGNRMTAIIASGSMTNGLMFPTIPLSPSPIEPRCRGLADLVERTPAYSLLHAGEHDLSGLWPPRLFPVNKLAMDFAPERVDDGYLEVLIVAQTAVTEMLRKRFAVCDSLEIVIEVDPDPVS